MKYIYLTEEFYNKYAHCSEIEKKKNRPYSMLLVQIDNVTWAIPLRSSIHHKNVIWSDKTNNCGLDLSKAVVIEDSKYISNNTPTIRSNEFNKLKGQDYIVYTKMKKYIKEYVKAYGRRDIKRNKQFCQYSTLQYFHKYINAFEQTDIVETDIVEVAIDSE